MVANDEREITAYHEAGHAVVGWSYGRLPIFVTIVPDGTGVVGRTQFEEEIPRRHLDESESKKLYTEARVLGELAGSIAVGIKMPERARDVSDEFDAKIAKQLVEELVSWEDYEIYLANAQQKASELVKRYWCAVEAVAQALLNHGTLNRVELLSICSPFIEGGSVDY
jgi:hypothetical protein